jgi:alkanesulfonate monooxygenase SsuD/methylene tetrahydromethanopterin reductase-like flavin-dependent oxidoreductase (luciferase family)
MTSLRVFTEPQQGASYGDLLAVARAAQECGYDAFFRSDHYLKFGVHTALPGYTDAWITLAGLARDTQTIRLGTMVSPVTYRAVGSFIIIAAQVDQMSGGRLEVGLGAGWYAAEHEAYGLPFPELPARYDLLEDQLAILHGCWSAPSGAAFEFSGRTCSVRLEPDNLRPYQRPHPPIVMGGAGGPRSARLAVSFADEYNVSFRSIDASRDIHQRVRRACTDAGRDPSTLSWSVAQTLCCGRNDAEIARRADAIGRDVDELRENGLTGTPAEVLDKLGRFAVEGVDRFYLQVLDITDLDQLRLVADEVMPYAPGR